MKYDAIGGALSEEVKALAVPVYFFLGGYDYTAPSELAAEYLASLSAPDKGLRWFEQSAHFPFLEESAKFSAEMIAVQRRIESH
jgi:pimeloyl-ACP methyl ester carboxylesterase